MAKGSDRASDRVTECAAVTGKLLQQSTLGLWQASKAANHTNQVHWSVTVSPADWHASQTIAPSGLYSKLSNYWSVEKACERYQLQLYYYGHDQNNHLTCESAPHMLPFCSCSVWRMRPHRVTIPTVHLHRLHVGVWAVHCSAPHHHQCPSREREHSPTLTNWS